MVSFRKNILIFFGLSISLLSTQCATKAALDTPPAPSTANANQPQIDMAALQKQNDFLRNSLIMNGAIDRLFEVQRLVRVGRTDDALENLKKLKESFPTMSAVYEMEGGIYYLRHKLPEALDDYRMASRFSSNNADSLKMIALLEKALGIKPQEERKPAAKETETKKEENK